MAAGLVQYFAACVLAVAYALKGSNEGGAFMSWPSSLESIWPPQARAAARRRVAKMFLIMVPPPRADVVPNTTR